MKRIIITEQQARFVMDKMIEEKVGFEKQTGVNVILSTKDPKTVKGYENRSLSQLAFVTNAGFDKKNNSILEPPNKEFLKTLSEIKGKMDETSAQIFDTIKVKNPKFYLWVIATYMGAGGGDVFGGRDTKNKKIVVDNSSTIKQEMVSPGKEGQEVEIPTVEQGYEMSTSPKIEQPMQFQFNEATMTPQFIQYINENIFGGIDEAIKNMTEELQKNGRNAVDVYVNKIEVSSSCSTIPNGKSKVSFPGVVPTFKELSDARAKSVYDYLIAGLTKRNAKFNQSGIIINSNGTNAGKQITIKSGDKMIEVDGTGTSGEPYVGQDKKELIKNQRVELGFAFAVRGSNPPKTQKVKLDPIPPQFAPVEVNDFMVRFTSTGRNILKLRPNIGLPRITLPSISLRGIFGRGTSMPCPKF